MLRRNILKYDDFGFLHLLSCKPIIEQLPVDLLRVILLYRADRVALASQGALTSEHEHSR